jgi:hypothetical protein
MITLCNKNPYLPRVQLAGCCKHGGVQSAEHCKHAVSVCDNGYEAGGADDGQLEGQVEAI